MIRPSLPPDPPLLFGPVARPVEVGSGMVGVSDGVWLGSAEGDPAGVALGDALGDADGDCVCWGVGELVGVLLCDGVGDGAASLSLIVTRASGS